MGEMAPLFFQQLSMFLSIAESSLLSSPVNFALDETTNKCFRMCTRDITMNTK